MANYAGLSYGNKVYCGAAIDPFITAGGQLTGLTCSQVYNHGANGAFSINGESVIIGAGMTIDVIIHHLPAGAEDLCYVCSCHDCNNPDGNAQRAVTWPAGTGTTETLINPSSPYTLIGSGFLNS